MPPRKTPLKAKKGLRTSKQLQAGPEGAQKARTPLKARNSVRARKAWLRAFHSPEFVQWIHERPCVRCGRTGSDPHHEPLRSQGGTWMNVSPVCPDCHTLGPDSRHRTSAAEFWASVGRSSEESNRTTHFAWLAEVGTT